MTWWHKLVAWWRWHRSKWVCYEIRDDIYVGNNVYMRARLLRLDQEIKLYRNRRSRYLYFDWFLDDGSELSFDDPRVAVAVEALIDRRYKQRYARNINTILKIENHGS